MTKKSKPASLTSSLLARKGEAEPAETPYSIAEASGQSTDSSSKEPATTNVEETPGVSEEAGTGNGQSMEGFGRLPLGDQDDVTEPATPEADAGSAGFTLPEGIQAGDPPIAEPVVTEPVVADPATEPVPDTALDLSNLGLSTEAPQSETLDLGAEKDDTGSDPLATASTPEPASDILDRADDAEKTVVAAAAMETQDAAPPPIMPNTPADDQTAAEQPADASAAAAADAEREAARDARLLRFVYIMAALTGIVAIVLYAGGWFVDKDTPQVAEQTPPTETVASADKTDSTTSETPAGDSAKPDTSGESAPGGTATAEPPSSGTPTPEPSETPSGSAAIPAAPPIAAPGFGESGSKPGETAITTGGKAKAKATATPDPKTEPAPAATDKKSASSIEVEPLKPPATPTLKAPETPTVTAKVPESAPASDDASKSAAPSSGTADSKPAAPAQTDGKEPASGQKTPETDSKVASVSPEKPSEPAAKPAVEPAAKPGTAAVPTDSPKVPDVQPPPILTAPKLPSAQKPAAAAKPAKKVPNLRVLAPALVRPEPPQTSSPATPPAAAKPSATAKIPKESKTAALTPPKKPVAAPSKSSGKFLIQLASVKSQKRAEAEWARLKKAFPKEFSGRDLVVEKRAIAGRGTFYRVQTGRFETLKDARAMCASLKGKKQACLPVAR